MKRLASCHAEACKEILAGVKSGRSLSDAVTDAIEALPAPKTRDLRRWLEDWQAWEEWARYKAHGWKIVKRGRRISVHAGAPCMWPKEAVIAAAVGVRSVRFVGDTQYNVKTGRPLISEYIVR